jgi:large subunit ribosomal protein L4
MELQVHSFANGETAGNVALSEDVFARDYNEPLIHQVVTAYFAGGRRGTKGSKSRSAVSGGGTKPFRQKGLGRARAGTIRSPIWRGGGVTFAAKPRDYSQKVNRKMYRSAMRSIFSELVRQDRLVVVDSCEMGEPRTKNLVASLQSFAIKDVLIIAEDVTENLYLSARNLHWVGLIDAATIDPAMLLAYEKVVVSKDALARIEELLK